MTRQRIIDHSVTGKELFAITRIKDRSLDSLDSIADKKSRDEAKRKWAADPILIARKAAKAKKAEEEIAKEKAAEEKRNAKEKAAEVTTRQPRTLTKQEGHILKAKKRKLDRLSIEALAASMQGKHKVAANRRQQLNAVIREIDELKYGKT